MNNYQKTLQESVLVVIKENPWITTADIKENLRDEYFRSQIATKIHFTKYAVHSPIKKRVKFRSPYWKDDYNYKVKDILEYNNNDGILKRGPVNRQKGYTWSF